VSSAPCCPTAFIPPFALGGPYKVVVPGTVKTATCFQGATPHDCPIPGFVTVVTPSDGGPVVITYEDAAGAPIPGTPVSVDCPEKVVVCEAAAPPPTPITLDGQDCAGLPLPGTGIEGQIVQVVQAPGQVLTVRMCTTENDREMVTMCAPDGSKVIVQNVTPEGAPLGTAPIFEAWNLDGSPFAGALATLVDCAAEKTEISDAEFFCDGTASYGRVTVWDVTTVPPTAIATVWQDVLGAVVPAPTNPLTVGACGESTPKQLTYIERNGGVLTMADIVAATGSNVIQTLTVVQIAGTGSVSGDSGSGAPLRPGQNQSWSVFSESTRDTLAASNLVLDAGGGEQFVTAVYIA
jgi:hypothetical protein